MACLCPITVINPRYRSLVKCRDKHVHDVPSFDRDGLPEDFKLTVPCGKCCECRKSRGKQWRTRLLHETLFGGHRRLWFVTMTLAPEVYDRFKDDPARAIRLFLERYRRKYGKSLRHWIITELGEARDRLHFHGIFFSPRIPTFTDFTQMWSYGRIWVGWVNPKTVNYIVKYITKLDLKHVDFVPQVFTSPGLGACYVLNPDNRAWLRSRPVDEALTCITHNCRAALPRYYYLKVFSDEEREYRRLVKNSLPPPERYFIGGYQFDSGLQMCHQRDVLYQRSLDLGLSVPLCRSRSSLGPNLAFTF